MHKIGLHRILVVLGLLVAPFLAAPLACAETLLVQFNDLSSDKGVIRCGLFEDEAHWRKEDQAIREAIAPIHQGRALCDFGDVPEGVYAVSAYHAEDIEDRLRFSFLGRPEQAVGFSMNPSRLFGTPSFDAAMFKMGQEPRVLMIELE